MAGHAVLDSSREPLTIEKYKGLVVKTSGMDDGGDNGQRSSTSSPST